MSNQPTVPTTVVIPTIGRPSLIALLGALGATSGPRPAQLIVVDDSASDSRSAGLQAGLPKGTTLLRSGGRGPAAARNLGWRAARTPWVSFLDDDVLPDPDWLARLATDISAAADDVVGIQGRLRVPLPKHRRPTDWERSTAGLATATWITADMTYRRSALSAAGGFDERFPRAYREDSDLALRVVTGGGQIVPGQRASTHPVRPAGPWASLRQQAGNADDVLMRRLHGRRWRQRVSAPPGRISRHTAITATGLGAMLAVAVGRRRLSAACALGAGAGVLEFALARIAPGPRNRQEVTRMVLTSLIIPPAAVWHRVVGLWRHRTAAPWRGLPDLVLFDRDGTLVHDVPYNGDPELARVMPGAHSALERLRASGVRVGMVTNQSGVGSGRITPAQVEAVNDRVSALLGPFDVIETCLHAADAGCGCRKPAPGMIQRACDILDLAPARCIVVGDIGSDVAAAQAAGAVGVLVPTSATRPAEIEQAPLIEPDLTSAADRILAGAW
ncbi:MAG: HAD-IIIA family hydrolase [Actinomycetota bacterium]|nr:HAD-IIIA family hydrolase [Actinomycetota bacterium]